MDKTVVINHAIAELEHRIRMYAVLLGGGRIRYSIDGVPPMPSKSKAQHKLMEMCAHNPSSAKGKCPPAKVAREFVAADKAAGKFKAKKK